LGRRTRVDRVTRSATGVASSVALAVLIIVVDDGVPLPKVGAQGHARIRWAGPIPVGRVGAITVVSACYGHHRMRRGGDPIPVGRAGEAQALGGRSAFAVAVRGADRI
jgi:hypothetical protein